MKKYYIVVALAILLSGCGSKDEKQGEAPKEEKVDTSTIDSKDGKENVEAVSGMQTDDVSQENLPKTEEPAKEVAPAKEAAKEAAKEVAPAKEAAKEAAKEVAPAKEVAKEVAPAKEVAKEATEKASGDINVIALYGPCMGCHGAKGEKVALGKSKIIKDMSEADIVKAMIGYKDGSYGGAMKGVMAGQVKKLNTAEMQALAKHIKTLK